MRLPYRTSSRPRHPVRPLLRPSHPRCRNADRYTDEELTFIHPDDAELYNQWDSKAFEVQVANHELLGHGSGKLFKENADGSKNFDPEKVRSVCAAGSCSCLLTPFRRSSTLSLASLCKWLRACLKDPVGQSLTVAAAHRGISLVRPPTQSSVRSPRQWRSAAQKPSHCIVSKTEIPSVYCLEFT